MFESMAGLHGPRDELKRYTTPLTGAYCFSPAAAAIVAMVRRHGLSTPLPPARNGCGARICPMKCGSW
jgi:hypothetical protein